MTQIKKNIRKLCKKAWTSAMIDCAKRQYENLRLYKHRLSSILNLAMFWETTPQGDAWWRNIYDELLNTED